VSGRHVLQLDSGPMYPGRGYPARPGEDRPGLSPFGRLAMGQTLGKPSILIYDHEACGTQKAEVDMLTIEGDDVDACQLVLTLHPPRVIPLPIEEVRERLDQQNLTGEQTNSEVTTGRFPGEHHHRPIRWPPLEAKILFGTGGVSTEVIVDYVNGVTLPVVASYVRAYALVSQSKRDGDIYGTSAAYYLAAHVGPGFSAHRAQRTVFVGKVHDNRESEVFDTPKFGKVAFISGRRTHDDSHHDIKHHAPVIAAGWIRFFQSPDGTNPVGDFFVSSYMSRVEVPNAGLYFAVYNQSGHEMNMAVVFELGL
jgi:hypothetical protein